LGKNLKKERKMITINSIPELIDHLKDNPEQEVFLDRPKGSIKKFGGVDPIEIPFDYGEFTDLINPSDKMGWDIILMPGTNKTDENLTPVGHVSYNLDLDNWHSHVDEEMPPTLEDNEKVFVASNGKYGEEERELIQNFFNDLWQFHPVEWY